jgi:hypothetical protein
MSPHVFARRDLLKLAGVVSASSMAGPVTMSRRAAGRRSGAAKRDALYRLLGDLPERRRPVSGRKTAEHGARRVCARALGARPQWHRDRPGLRRAAARAAGPVRRPAVVFNHSHGGGYTIGKTEFIEGRSYLQPVPYAKALTDLGYVALCIDHWVFGERNHATELDTFKEMLWRGRVLWGQMIYDSLKAVDWLVHARRRRSGPRGDAWHVDGELHGAVPRRARHAHQGHGGYLLPRRLRDALAKHAQARHGVYMYVPGCSSTSRPPGSTRSSRRARI